MSPGTPLAEPELGQTPPVPTTGWLETLRWFARRRVRVRVHGESMLPVLQAGDEVLVDPTAALVIGTIVVARHPFRSDVHVVKRLAGWDNLGRAVLLGLNTKQSTDSRTIGNVPRELVIGTVTSRLPGSA